MEPGYNFMQRVGEIEAYNFRTQTQQSTTTGDCFGVHLLSISLNI